MESNDSLVLVTGSSGWLGSYLVETLKSNSPLAKQLVSDVSKVRTFEGDLRDPDACAAFCKGAKNAVLIHCAGIIHPNKVKEFYQVNVQGTKNLLDAAAKEGVKRVVVVSSNSPLGCNPTADHKFDESSPYNPYMNYGRSKMEMEKLVQSYSQQKKFETVIIRAPWFYGPNQPPRQTLFFQMVRDGKFPIVGDGSNNRSMAYIGNLVQGLLLAATSPKANGKIYWIADDRPYSMNEIVDTVERLLEKEFGQVCRKTRMKLPGVLGDVATIVDASLQKVGMYHQKIHVLSEMNKTIACSVEKAKQELGYKPDVDLEEGMRRSLKWCVSVGALKQ